MVVATCLLRSQHRLIMVIICVKPLKKISSLKVRERTRKCYVRTDIHGRTDGRTDRRGQFL